jgi:hypothetical protein
VQCCGKRQLKYAAGRSPNAAENKTGIDLNAEHWFFWLLLVYFKLLLLHSQKYPSCNFLIFNFIQAWTEMTMKYKV